MTEPTFDAPGGGVATLVLAGFAVTLFGLVGGLPYLVGPLVGVVGLGAAALARRSSGAGPTLGPVPVLLALGVLAVTSPAVPAAVLFGGFATVAVLLWLADDPGRPSGGGRRAVLALGSGALAVVIAGSLVLVARVSHAEVGVAGGILAFVLLLLAYLLVRGAGERPRPGATA